jgi:hypothetical protein
MFLYFHNGLCDNRNDSSESQKGESNLVHCQGFMVYVQVTFSQTAASRLTSVILFWVLSPSDHYLGLLKKSLGGHKCQNVSEVHEVGSQHFHSQSLEFYDDGIHSLIML